jgi:hypothetical protein
MPTALCRFRARDPRRDGVTGGYTSERYFSETPVHQAHLLCPAGDLPACGSGAFLVVTEKTRRRKMILLLYC